MDIKQIINGKEHVVCCPDSWYIAKQISLEHHEDYDIIYERTGTAAKLKLVSKKRVVDFYDKEHITYLKGNSPPEILGDLYWIGDELNKVSYSIKENETVCSDNQNTDCFFIFHEIFKHLRDFDIIEIRANYIDPETQKLTPMIYRSNKKWIIDHGYHLKEINSRTYCYVKKSVFYRCLDAAKINSQKGTKNKWMKRNKKN